MRDYLKRFLIAGIMALCISLLFLGGREIQAEMLNIKDITTHWIWPADGVITDTYGSRHGAHNGIDIAGAYGTSIFSVDDGIVSKSYYSSSYGHVVFIKHNNNLETVYAHLKKRNVEEGQEVHQGDIIGEMGSTGHSSGVHLHFEVHEHEWTVDKRNAINPVAALGNVEVGEAVKVLDKEKKLESVMATLAKMPLVNRPDQTQIDYIQGEALNDKKRNSQKEDIVHVVKKGESLWSIAEKYQSSVESIKTVNQLEDDMIHPSQKIIIQSQPTNKYIVQPGDTLTSISEKTNVSIDVLMEKNNLSNDVIFPQQTLIFGHTE